MSLISRSITGLAVSLAFGMSFAHAQAELSPAEVQNLRQTFKQRVPQLPPIESVRATPMPGVYELKIGREVMYSDAKGDFVIEGQLIDTKTRSNLTQQRIDEINLVNFNDFPFKDAVVWKTGNGKRRLVVFADPNCGYCKQLERELRKASNLTVYTFMIPILGPDSRVKTENIWCGKDRVAVWSDWMLKGVVPPQPFSACKSPTDRNLALSQSLGVNGTPAMFFEDGTRLASAAPLATVEQRLNQAAAKARR